MEKNKKRILWLSILQGWAMLLVVLGHVDLDGNAADINHPLTGIIHNTIYSFHMPLFIFISGFLYYLSKISKNKSYKQTIIEKFKRLYIPMIFFTLITFLPKVLLASIMKHPAELSLKYILDTFIFYKTNPLAEMWFIITLFMLMALYSLYLWANNNKRRELFLLFVFALLSFMKVNCTYFQLTHVVYMLFFFYFGILTCKYHLYRYLQSYLALILSIAAFIGSEMISIAIPQLINIFGIIFSFSLCINIAKFIPNLFLSFRLYTYQIFLMGIFFQMCIRYLYKYDSTVIPYWGLYLLSVLVGIYVPVVITLSVKKLNCKYLNYCLGI